MRSVHGRACAHTAARVRPPTISLNPTKLWEYGHEAARMPSSVVFLFHNNYRVHTDVASNLGRRPPHDELDAPLSTSLSGAAGEADPHRMWRTSPPPRSPAQISSSILPISSSNSRRLPTTSAARRSPGLLVVSHREAKIQAHDRKRDVVLSRDGGGGTEARCARHAAAPKSEHQSVTVRSETSCAPCRSIRCGQRQFEQRALQRPHRQPRRARQCVDRQWRRAERGEHRRLHRLRWVEVDPSQRDPVIGSRCGSRRGSRRVAAVSRSSSSPSGQ